MTFLRLLPLLIALCAGVATRAAGPGAVRVVSHSVGGDELLLAVAAPGQVVALSHLSRDPTYSAVSEEARAYPQTSAHGDAESILKFDPTLVLFADYSRIELVEQVRRAGVRVIVINRYETLDDAYANLRMVAAELGRGEQAERVIADCNARVAALERRLRGVVPAKVIAPSTFGVIPGDRTTFQDLCDHAGAENLAATLGHLHGHVAPPVEQMLTWPIDRVVLAGHDAAMALEVFRSLSPYDHMAAVREGRAVLIPPYQIACVSQHRIEGYEALARALHPEVFR
jgi:iron complex transport system substrate-binding protein